MDIFYVTKREEECFFGITSKTLHERLNGSDYRTKSKFVVDAVYATAAHNIRLLENLVKQDFQAKGWIAAGTQEQIDTDKVSIGKAISRIKEIEAHQTKLQLLDKSADIKAHCAKAYNKAPEIELRLNSLDFYGEGSLADIAQKAMSKAVDPVSLYQLCKQVSRHGVQLKVDTNRNSVKFIFEHAQLKAKNFMLSLGFQPGKLVKSIELVV